MICSFINKFTEKTILGIVQAGRNYFLAGELVGLKDKIGKEIFSMGIYLGEEKDEFRPSPALLDIISKHSDKKAFVDDKAEWMFLCGKDIFRKAIVGINKELKKNDLVLVQNQKDENLGYGKLVMQGNVEIKNLLDKGSYLRERQ